MNLILIGAPGAGKGTQAEVISERFEIPQISTGDTLRAAIKAGTELGKSAKALIESGKFVPDEVMNPLVRNRLAEADCANGFILDGYPRGIPQAEALEETGVKIDKVLYINVPDEIIVDRLSGRRICEECGASYHIQHNPSSAGEMCEHCGGKLVIRKDDRAETVKERLRIFHEATYPVVEFYREKGLLVEIDGAGSVEQTTEKVLRALEDDE